jgi:hypothetical protein
VWPIAYLGHSVAQFASIPAFNHSITLLLAMATIIVKLGTVEPITITVAIVGKLFKYVLNNESIFSSLSYD